MLSDEISQFPISISDEFADYCSEWHGGQTSPMYSVASTQTIHSEEILIGLIKEIRNVLVYSAKVGEEDCVDESVQWLSMVTGFLPDKPLVEVSDGDGLEDLYCLHKGKWCK